MFKSLYYKYKYITITITNVLIFSMIWYFLENYYTEYESFISKIFAYNFGDENTQIRFKGFSPLGFILFENIFSLLHNIVNTIYWYDIIMYCLLILSIIQFSISAKFLKLNTVPYFLLSFLLFYWIVRHQNHTHISYLLVFNSLFLISVLINNKTSKFHLFIGYFGFAFSFFLRWETALIGFLIYSLYFFLYQKKKNTLKLSPIFVIGFTILCGIFLKFKLSVEFYRQIEPDGEYVILYEKALRLPPYATALDTLKHEMLNNWIVDDTSLISIDYFKEAVAYAKSYRDKDYYLNKLKEGSNRFQDHLKKRWYMSLFFLFIGLYYVYYKRDFKFLFFIFVCYSMIFFLAYNSLLNDRHYYSILNGLLIISVSSFQIFNNKKVQFYLFISSLLVLMEINTSIELDKSLHNEYIEKISFIKSNNKHPVFLDFQYISLFNNRALQRDSLIENAKFLSLSQHSFNLFFIKSINNIGCTTPLDKLILLKCLLNKYGKINILISQRRLTILKKILFYKNSKLIFKEINSFECKDSENFMDCIKYIEIYDIQQNNIKSSL